MKRLNKWSKVIDNSVNLVITNSTGPPIIVRFNRDIVITVTYSLYQVWATIFVRNVSLFASHGLGFSQRGYFQANKSPFTDRIWPTGRMLPLPAFHSQTCVQRPPSGPQICGRCSEVAFNVIKDSNWDSKMVVAVGSWSLFGGGR
jgi:hypothetical protein